MDIDYRYFSSIKGEFEAEGLTRDNVASEALFAARRGLDYLVKIGGAEASADVTYLADLGVLSLVCPMVETPFAMKKYMEMLVPGVFEHVGVTIETTTAVANIEDVLSLGDKLTDVTIGRSDLTASYGGGDVDSPRTTDMVKKVAKEGRSKNLKITMGGSVSKSTHALLQTDSELRNLLDYVETRKAVIPIEKFMDEAALDHALRLEKLLLARRARSAERTLGSITQRLTTLDKRAK